MLQPQRAQRATRGGLVGGLHAVLLGRDKVRGQRLGRRLVQVGIEVVGAQLELERPLVRQVAPPLQRVVLQRVVPLVGRARIGKEDAAHLRKARAEAPKVFEDGDERLRLQVQRQHANLHVGGEQPAAAGKARRARLIAMEPYLQKVLLRGLQGVRVLRMPRPLALSLVQPRRNVLGWRRSPGASRRRAGMCTATNPASAATSTATTSTAARGGVLAAAREAPMLVRAVLRATAARRAPGSATGALRLLARVGEQPLEIGKLDHVRVVQVELVKEGLDRVDAHERRARADRHPPLGRLRLGVLQPERQAQPPIGAAQLLERLAGHAAVAVRRELLEDLTALGGVEGALRSHRHAKQHGRAPAGRSARAWGTLDDPDALAVPRKLPHRQQVGHVVQTHEVVVRHAAEAERQQRLA